jgi:uncharacterized membrane protein YfcA
MLGLLFLLGFAILILSAVITGLIAGLIAGLVRWTLTRRKGALFRLAWPPMLTGAIGGFLGCLVGLGMGVQRHLLTCQGSGPDCQFEAASYGFSSGFFGAGMGAITGAMLIILLLGSRQLFQRQPGR